MDSYEKKYKEALEEAKKIIEYYKEHNRGDEASIEDLEGIFPELKESEDELTWLTKYIEEEAYSLSIDIRDNEDRIKLKNLQKALAWLEKQAERKTPQWMIDFLDNYRRMIGCSLDYDEARDVDGKILCIKDWLEKQGEKPQGKPALEAINEEKVDNQNCIKPKFKESMTDYERGYIDGRKAMAEKIQIILNAILFDNEKNEKYDNYNHPALGCISQSRADNSGGESGDSEARSATS